MSFASMRAYSIIVSPDAEPAIRYLARFSILPRLTIRCLESHPAPTSLLLFSAAFRVFANARALTPLTRVRVYSRTRSRKKEEKKGKNRGGKAKGGERGKGRRGAPEGAAADSVLCSHGERMYAPVRAECSKSSPFSSFFTHKCALGTPSPLRVLRALTTRVHVARVVSATYAAYRSLLLYEGTLPLAHAPPHSAVR